jgi:integrase/recombinase XerD
MGMVEASRTVGLPDWAPAQGESVREETEVQRHIEHFLESIAEENYAANTVLAYQGDLAQLLEYLGQQDKAAWEQVTEEDITNYLFHLRQREYATSTITRKMAALSSFFGFLKVQEIVADDPTSNVSLPQARRASTGEVLSEQEVEQLLAHIAQDETPRGLRDQVLLGLMAKVGFRPSQLMALDLDDVDTLCRDLSSQGHYSLRDALERYVEEGRSELAPSEEDQSALFLSVAVGAGGGRLTRQGGWLIVKERAEACGLGERVSPRALRRTHLAHNHE